MIKGPHWEFLTKIFSLNEDKIVFRFIYSKDRIKSLKMGGLVFGECYVEHVA